MWRPVVRLDADDQRLLQELAASSSAMREQLDTLTAATSDMASASAAASSQLAELTIVASGLADTAHSQEERPSWLVPAWIASGLALILGGVCVWLGALAFGTPEAGAVDASGSVLIGIERKAGDPNLDLDTVQVGMWYDAENEEVNYQLAFPKDFQGRRYAVITTGEGQLTTIDEPAEGSTQTLAGCQSRTDCTIVTGTIPIVQSVQLICTGAIQQKDFFDYAMVKISGSSVLATHPDWAHQSYDLPGVALSGTNTEVSSFEGVELDRPYQFLAAFNTCASLGVPDGWTPSDVSGSAAVTQNGGVVSWTAGDTSSRSVVLRDKNAEQIGSVLIAIGGAFAGLAVGLIPMLIEGHRRRRVGSQP